MNGEPLLDWLRGTGATKVAIRFGVDTVDGAADLVALSIAEFIPREGRKSRVDSSNRPTFPPLEAVCRQTRGRRSALHRPASRWVRRCAYSSSRRPSSGRRSSEKRASIPVRLSAHAG